MTETDMLDAIYECIDYELRKNKDCMEDKKIIDLFLHPYMEKITEMIGADKAQEVYMDMVMSLYDKYQKDRIHDFAKGIWLGIMISENAIENKKESYELLKKLKASIMEKMDE